MPIRAIRGSSAFTLVELLVVVMIILIVMVLVMPATKGISAGMSLTGAAEEIGGGVSFARQRASTFNRQVAIRFYEKKGDPTLFKSYQLWEKPDISSDPDAPGSWKAIDAERELPTGVAIKKDATHSALLEIFKDLSETKPRGQVKYSEALFTPAGSLVAPSDKAHFTLVPEVGLSTGGTVSGLPSNFATLVIEPVNSRTTIYRP